MNAGILIGLEGKIDEVVPARWSQFERKNVREGKSTAAFNKDLASQIAVGAFPHTLNASHES